MSKYFTLTVKPPIAVAALAAGNITDAEILFDWHGFDVPKGASKLIGITALYTGKNGVDYTPTDFELIWGKSNADASAPITMGDDGAAVDTFGWFNNIIGKTYMDASNGRNDGDLITGNNISAASPGGGTAAANNAANLPMTNQLVLQGEPDSGTNVGYDKIYVAAIAKDTHNWGASTMTVDGSMSTSSSTLTVADLSAIIACGPGDVLRDEDGLLFGTVKTVDSATSITLESNLAATSTNDKIVYNTTPITLILSFER